MDGFITSHEELSNQAFVKFDFDLHLRRIGNPRQMALILNQIPGVVENGLFIDICDIVVIGHGDGRVVVRDINAGSETDGRILFAPTDNIFSDLGD